MRTLSVALFALAITILLPIDRGQADPYRWCADYGGTWRGYQLLFRHPGAVPCRDIGKRWLLPAERLLRWPARDDGVAGAHSLTSRRPEEIYS